MAALPEPPDLKETRGVQYMQKLTESGNTYCTMDIRIGNRKPQRVVFELYSKDCPKTSQNFVQLCVGGDGPLTGEELRYKDCPFHRIVKNGWVQGGDVVGGTGADGHSTFEEKYFEDESFSVQFDHSGILAMANCGPHTNNSQFFISLAPLPFLNTKNVGFGRVVKGFNVFRSIERLETVNERPTVEVIIERCSVIDLDMPYYPQVPGQGRR